MKALFVFDHTVRPFATPAAGAVDLLPLTSDWPAIEALREVLNGRVLNAGKLLEEALEGFPERLARWSAALGAQDLGGRSLKEWFRGGLPRGSAWWFSLLSEKNPLKSPVFLRIAQVRVVERQWDTGGYDELWVASAALGKTLEAFGRRRGVRVRRLPANAKLAGRRRLSAMLRAFGIFGELLIAAGWFAAAWRRGRKARRRLGSPRRVHENALLAVTYFPAVDPAAAAEGRFVNRYMAPLQARLAQEKRPINWVLMTSEFDGIGFDEALDLAKKFDAGGESMRFLEEFLTAGAIFRILRRWFRQIVVYIDLSPSLYKGLGGEEIGILLRPEWRRSIVGIGGLQGLYYWTVFEGLWKKFTGSPCLYLCEMHAWEIALNATRGSTRAVAFQHGALPRNLFCYSHDRSEIEDKSPSALPLPDVIAANGDGPISEFAHWGYPNVKRVEALRQFHLIPWLNGSGPAGDRAPVLLVAGSYDQGSTRALLNLARAAFPDPKNLEIWLNGHPCTPVERVLENLGGPVWPVRVRREPARDLLSQARWVLVADSSVSLDALVMGASVIVPVLPDALPMSPLDNAPDLYTKVYTPDELRRAVETSRRPSRARVKEFVTHYWSLDPELSGWKTVLA